MGKLKVINWNVATNCNLHCSMCYGYKADEIAETYLQFKIIDRLVEVGIQGIIF